MNEKVNAWLKNTQPPWLGIAIETEEDKKWIPSALYGADTADSIIRELRGHRMQTVPALMNEFAAALQFFRGFGANWHALSECLCYLDEWLPGTSYLLIIDDVSKVLVNEREDELKWLLMVLDDVGKWWSKPITENDRFNREALPFHVMFKCSAEEYADVKTRFKGLVGEKEIESLSD